MTKTPVAKKTAEQPAPALTLETWPIERLTANPENYRTHPDAQLEHLRESLRAFGWYRNVVCTPEGMCLAGHGIIAAAKAEGHVTVPVHVFRGTEAEVRKLMVADNEASRLAEDDPDQLSQLLASIAAESEHGLQGTGHDEESLAALLEEVAGQDADAFANSLKGIGLDVERQPHEGFHFSFEAEEAAVVRAALDKALDRLGGTVQGWMKCDAESKALLLICEEWSR